MGYNIYSNTFKIVGESGLVASRSMTRRSQAERWNAEALARVQVAPGTSYVPANRGQVRFADQATATGPTTESVKTSALRKLRINQSDLDEFGYYASCPQCTYVQRHGRPRAGTTHTAECRNRIIEALKLTDSGRARLEMQETRDQLAQEGQQTAAPKPAEPKPPPAAPRGFLDRAEAPGASRPEAVERNQVEPPLSGRPARRTEGLGCHGCPD